MEDGNSRRFRGSREKPGRLGERGGISRVRGHCRPYSASDESDRGQKTTTRIPRPRERGTSRYTGTRVYPESPIRAFQFIGFIGFMGFIGSIGFMGSIAFIRPIFSFDSLSVSFSAFSNFGSLCIDSI